MDYEYPGGNGADYKTVPNSNLVKEIDAFPKLLSEIRSAIGLNKTISLACPGLERDMIGYTNTTVPLIAKEIDFLNIMTYDLMNRRDNFTSHHTSVNASLAAVDRYLALGLPPQKANLGIAFYAKYFTVAANNCTELIGCPVALLEDVNGTDTGLSGAMTFEASNAVPTNLTVTEAGGSCGAATSAKCPGTQCCSQSVRAFPLLFSLFIQVKINRTGRNLLILYPTLPNSAYCHSVHSLLIQKKITY